MPNPSERERADPRGEPLTDSELAEVAARCAAVESSEDWARDRADKLRFTLASAGCPAAIWYDDDDLCAEVYDDMSLGLSGNALAEFFAYARGDVPRLLATLEARRAQGAAELERQRLAFAVHWQGLLRAREDDLRAANEHAAALAADVDRLDAELERTRAWIEERAGERHLPHGSPGKEDRFWGCSRLPCQVASAFLRGLARFRCRARESGTAGGNDPQDCDWPFCGCYPEATKVLEAVEECGRFVEREKFVAAQAERDQLRHDVAHLADRLAAAHDVLARRAEVDPDRDALRALLGRARAALESVRGRMVAADADSGAAVCIFCGRPWRGGATCPTPDCVSRTVREVLGAMERAGV